MKGYKVFNSDWTCRGFQYKVGETYEMDEEPIICQRGFHFCSILKDCFYHYPLDPNKIKIAEIEALGKIDEVFLGYTQYCTNKIKIVREIYWKDLKFTKENRFGTLWLSYPHDLGTINFNKSCFPLHWGTKIIVLSRKLDEDAVISRANGEKDPVYIHHVQYTAITDIKEKPHEL